jgi:formate dehydrogenase beta subunit
VFYVYEDPRIAEIEGTLAGANCGGCGLCRLCAAAAVQRSLNGQGTAPGVCVVAGPETAVASVADIMGIDAGNC